jgi:TatD DNase family protein
VGEGLFITNRYQAFEKASEGGLCSLGIHPWYVDADFDNQLAQLEQYATLPNVVAIGECGLDKVTATSWDLQAWAFRIQIQLANTLHKPLIIHCVRAYDEVLQMLKLEQVQVPVVFHGFNKNVQVAERILNRGYYLSFGAALLKDNGPAIAAIQCCPATSFFLETDDTDFSIGQIYEKAADVRKTGEDALILQLQKNFQAVFNI